MKVKHYDTIAVTGISGHGHHGVFEHERREGQNFVVDVTVYLDTRAAASGDELGATVHYGELSNKVHALITGPAVDLIETLAQKIAEAALNFEAAQAVDVTVHKPQAPIEVPFSDVSITIHRTAAEMVPEVAQPATQVEPVPPAPPPPPAPRPAETEPSVPVDDLEEQQAQENIFDQRPLEPTPAILALGANLGEPQQTLASAIADLAATAGIELVDVSPLARTAPVGPEQPDFYNCVVRVLTTLTPRELLRAGNEIESDHGRERHEHWGPRTLDIDIITYGNIVGISDDLEIPHPRAHERAFVLSPWAELEPGGFLPGLGGGPVAVLAASAPDRDGIRWMSLDWLG